MLGGRQVGLHHETGSHCTPPGLSDVHWGLEAVAQLELRGLHGDDPQDRQLLDQLLWRLAHQARLAEVPRGSLKEEPLDIAPELRLLLDVLGVGDLSHLGVKG